MQAKDYNTWKEEYLAKCKVEDHGPRHTVQGGFYKNVLLSTFEKNNDTATLNAAVKKPNFEEEVTKTADELREKGGYFYPDLGNNFISRTIVAQKHVFEDFNQQYGSSRHIFWKTALALPPIGVAGTYVTGAIIDAASHNHNAVKAINDFFVNNAKEIGGSLASYYGVLLLVYIVKSCMKSKAASQEVPQVPTQDHQDNILLVADN